MQWSINIILKSFYQIQLTWSKFNQGQGSQTLFWIGMMAILMIVFLGAKCFCINEEQVVEEPVEEEVHPRGLFSQVIEKTMSFFGH